MKRLCLVVSLVGLLFGARLAHAQNALNPPLVPVDREATLTSDSVRTSWVLRFGGSILGFGHPAREEQGRAGSMLFGGVVEYYSAHLLTGRLYLMTGGSVTLGQLSSSRCLSPECTKDDDDPNLGKFHGFGAAWGPSAALAFKLAPGREYLALWLPELRLQHLLANRARSNSACSGAYGSHGCSGWSFDNVVASVGAGLELAHGDGMSCGLDLAYGVNVGGLAGRNEGHTGRIAAERLLLVQLIYNYDGYVPIRR